MVSPELVQYVRLSEYVKCLLYPSESTEPLRVKEGKRANIQLTAGLSEIASGQTNALIAFLLRAFC